MWLGRTGRIGTAVEERQLLPGEVAAHGKTDRQEKFLHLLDRLGTEAPRLFGEQLGFVELDHLPHPSHPSVLAAVSESGRHFEVVHALQKKFQLSVVESIKLVGHISSRTRFDVGRVGEKLVFVNDWIFVNLKNLPVSRKVCERYLFLNPDFIYDF